MAFYSLYEVTHSKKKQIFPVKEPGKFQVMERLWKDLYRNLWFSFSTIFMAQVNHKHWVKPLLQQFRIRATLVTVILGFRHGRPWKVKSLTRRAGVMV